MLALPQKFRSGILALGLSAERRASGGTYCQERWCLHSAAHRRGLGSPLRFRTIQDWPKDFPAALRQACGKPSVIACRLVPSVAQTPPDSGGSPHAQNQAPRVHHSDRRCGGVAARGGPAATGEAADHATASATRLLCGCKADVLARTICQDRWRVHRVVKSDYR